MHDRTLRRGLPAASALVAAASAAALCLMLACGDGEPPAPAPPPAAAPADATPPAEAPAAETPAAMPESEAKVTTGELPANYPPDLPTYPNAKPGTAVEVPGGGMLVTFESDDPAQTISDYLRRELGSQGWEVTDLAVGDFKATKEGRNTRITVSEESGAPTRITVGTTALN